MRRERKRERERRKERKRERVRETLRYKRMWPNFFSNVLLLQTSSSRGPFFKFKTDLKQFVMFCLGKKVVPAAAAAAAS